MRFVRFLALVSVAGVATAALGAPASAGKRELVIGSLAPESGSLQTLLESLRTPVQMAVEEINAAGGIDGVPVRFTTADEGDDAEYATARASFDRLVDEGADVVIGPSTSGAALALQQRIGNREVLTCSGSDTAAPLAPDTTGSYYFRTAPPDRLQGRALAELVLADGRSDPAVLYRDDSYGGGLDRPLVKALKNGGADVVANRAYDPEHASLEADVRAVLNRDPDALVLLGFPDDGAALLDQLAQAGVTASTLPIYGGDTMQSPSFKAAVPDIARLAGLKGTVPAASPSDINSPFDATLAARNIDPVFSAHAYDCTILAALAAVSAESTDPSKLKDAFTANLRGKNDCNTFAACTTLLDAGKTIHWRGASSDFDDFAKFEPNEGAYDQWSWDATGTLDPGDPTTQILVSG
jgi:branched-chain amino acid transport system substrate-binding protein